MTNLKYLTMTVKEMRRRTGLTQEEFALTLNVPKRTIGNWESGQSSCPDYVRQLIQFYLFREGYIVNEKITYVFTSEYDESKPGNGFPEETDDIIVAKGEYDFEDFLRDNGVYFEEDENCEGLYWVTDYDGERTGAAYQVLKIEDTDEELRV